MSFWTDTSGKELTAKEFMNRWKGGIQKVTPLQQASVALFGYLIVVIGIIIGIIVSWMAKTWWIVIVLIGSLLITSTAIIGAYQKLFILRSIENIEINDAT